MRVTNKTADETVGECCVLLFCCAGVAMFYFVRRTPSLRSKVWACRCFGLTGDGRATSWDHREACPGRWQCEGRRMPESWPGSLGDDSGGRSGVMGGLGKLSQLDAEYPSGIPPGLALTSHENAGVFVERAYGGQRAELGSQESELRTLEWIWTCPPGAWCI